MAKKQETPVYPPLPQNPSPDEQRVEVSLDNMRYIPRLAEKKPVEKKEVKTDG